MTLKRGLSDMWISLGYDDMFCLLKDVTTSGRVVIRDLGIIEAQQ